MAVAVVERYKQESMVWTVLRDNKKSGRCGEVAVSGDSTVFIFWRFDDSLTAALSTLRKDWRFKNQNDLKGIKIRVSGNFQLLRVFKITAKE